MANLIKNIGIVGTHAKVEDLNHSLAHGNLAHAQLIRNDSVGYKQDDWFFKTRIPSVLKMISLDLLQMTGLYGYARPFYSSVKSVIRWFS